MPWPSRSITAPGSVPGALARSRSAMCDRVATATSLNSAMRAPSAMSARSISAHRLSRPKTRSATTNIAAMSATAAPSSSASSNGRSTPRRLTIRLASLVATISPRRRCSSIALAKSRCIAGGKAACRSGASSGASARGACSIPSCNDSFAVASSTASSGRVRPLPSCPRRSRSSLPASPSTARSSRPAPSKISMTRT
ncbi:hypothetical protein WR25_18436 [Diploscapter pachys]|uniref:Uncharacterized protein n=1 Tax=Diploscapter pachys TaxID=2018661 RepID=A0A2A2M4Q4_9BILA|nr:hypothetical protein WR25_18436 [Diploscapter pachys]